MFTPIQIHIQPKLFFQKKETVTKEFMCLNSGTFSEYWEVLWSSPNWS